MPSLRGNSTDPEFGFVFGLVEPLVQPGRLPFLIQMTKRSFAFSGIGFVHFSPFKSPEVDSDSLGMVAVSRGRLLLDDKTHQILGGCLHDLIETLRSNKKMPAKL